MNDSFRFSVIGGSLALMVIGVAIVNIPVAVAGIASVGALAFKE